MKKIKLFIYDMIPRVHILKDYYHVFWFGKEYLFKR